MRRNKLPWLCLPVLLWLLLSPLFAAAGDIGFSVLLGGSGYDHPAGDLVVDSDGFIYVTGSTRSADFPVTQGAFDTTFNDKHGESDAFVAKLDPSGAIVWSTYLGTVSRDAFYTVRVDREGYVYLAGAFGPGAPTTPGVLQQSFGGAEFGEHKWDGYIAKLAPDGSRLVWATYLGFADDEVIRSMDVASNGDIVLVTSREYGRWPEAWFAGRYQARPQGGIDTVVVRLAGDGKSVRWASYLGGRRDESTGPNMVLGAQDQVHVFTETASANMPTTRDAHDSSYNGGSSDMYLATLSADGRDLLMGTYLGSSSSEGGGGKGAVRVGPSGNIYISGWTKSSRFPVTSMAGWKKPLDFSPWRATGVTARFSPAGKLLAATYGGDTEGLALDTQGNVVIALEAWGDDVPVSPNALQAQRAGRSDAAVLVLSPGLQRMLYATYLGGRRADGAHIATVGEDGSLYISGLTYSSDFPRKPDEQRPHSGDADVFIVKLQGVLAE